MSILHLNHIRGELEKTVAGNVDDSDLLTQGDDARKQCILSRSLALFSLKSLTGRSYDELQESVTDGYGDNGIDALFLDAESNIFYIVQSKWISAARGGPNKGEVLKLVHGVKQLLNLEFVHFNDKIRAKKQTITEAFYNSKVKVRIILTYTGDNLSQECLSLIHDFTAEINDANEVIQFDEYNLKDCHRALSLGIEGGPIDLELDLYQWGTNTDPVTAIYGQTDCALFARLYEQHKMRLFAQNIRGFIGESDINSQIVSSLVKAPEYFFYLNNGITVLAKKISKSPFGGNGRTVGHFSCENITIVNGAQTVGSIYEAYRLSKEQVVKGSVHVRIISLENCPTDFDKQVTTATNTQNKIEKKDFVSLDPEQHRLKRECLLEGVNYHFKRDATIPRYDSSNVYLEEATVALACLHQDVTFATYAKREISRLWSDLPNSPYKHLFNERLTGIKLLKAIKIHRTIEKELKDVVWGARELDILVQIHGGYLIAHLVFQCVDRGLLNDPNRLYDEAAQLGIVKLTKSYKQKVVEKYHALGEWHFPPTSFKNSALINRIKTQIFEDEGKVIPGRTLPLFDAL